MSASFVPLWAAAVLLPLVALAGGAGWSWQLVRADARTRIERTAATLREHALRAFETQDALLAAVQRLTQDMTWEEIAASEAVAAFLRDLDAATPGAGAIGMIAPDGRLAQISSSPFPPPPTRFADRDYVRAQQDPATAAPYVGVPITARLGGVPVFAYSRPRLGADGRPDGGALWATFRIEELRPFYAGLLEHPRDVIGLARADGTVLIRHPPAPGDAGPLRLPEDARQMAAIRALLAAGAAQAARPVVFDEAASPVDGRPRLYATARVGSLPVFVTYGLHPDGPRAAWLRQVAAMAGVAGVAMLLLLWLVRLVTLRAGQEAAALERARAAAEARAEAEARLRAGQRLEALGQLAAGVAHDFRNLIQAVQGGARLVRHAAEAGDTARAVTVADMLAETAGRGLALTSRMLHVARPGQDAEGAGATLDPLAVCTEAAALLDSTLGAGLRVRLAVEAGAPPARVRGRQAELEAALLNLCVNARDAMPRGGEVTLVLGGETVAAGGPAHPAGLAPGRYARIAVTDAGAGMDAATLARAGEAFFTTKPQGTGLGLAGVRGFVAEAGGAVRIASPGPGRGTTVTLWLPEAGATP
ncbi:hybrid sensor histidine kinase/response regulator [Roseicella aquatilis]|uniref:hybrid sensor histidine kinase/response regulator n=1 Tax=Roseicella aquatilis TaxID=2527868 RepID=UPI00105394AD|nr:hybrid sensor histidine kinase/response regulator [Roseicella aquatilis]